MLIVGNANESNSPREHECCSLSAGSVVNRIPSPQIGDGHTTISCPNQTSSNNGVLVVWSDFDWENISPIDTPEITITSSNI